MDSSDILIPAYLVILPALAVFGFHRAQMIYLYYKYRHRKPRAAGTFAELPAVTVQLPLFNEMYVAERLLDAVAMIRLSTNTSSVDGRRRLDDS